MFVKNQIDDSEEEIIDITEKIAINLKLYSSQTINFFYLIAIHEIHSRSECSETKDVQTSIITALTDIFGIIYLEPDEIDISGL